MILSVVIPAHNEEGCIEENTLSLLKALKKEKINFELLVVNDGSSDSTQLILEKLSKKFTEIRYINNEHPNGFGLAIRAGLEQFIGDAVVLFMADGSDSPRDVICFFREIEKGLVDCVFGSRFIKGGETHDYPMFKLLINRFVNNLIRFLFGFKYNDTTNAFKMYRKTAIDGLRPFLSHHFNLTVELPLKAITRGYSYSVIPNSWINRTTGVAKLKLREMGSRYLFIVLYCLIEKWLSLGDYRK